MRIKMTPTFIIGFSRQHTFAHKPVTDVIDYFTATIVSDIGRKTTIMI
jgi:hypothetical protein